MPAKGVRLGYLNQVAVLGRVVMEPDLRYTPSGAAVLELRVVVNKRYKDKATQEWKEDASFFGVTLWRATAEYVSKKARKGSPVLVTGEIKSRSWEGKDGEKKSIVFINGRTCQVLELPAASGPEAGQTGPQSASGTGSSEEDEPDMPTQLDNIPF